MKFGKALARAQVPEWSRHYMHYKALKQLIKAARQIYAKPAPVKTRTHASSPMLSNVPARQRPPVRRNHSDPTRTFESTDAAVIAFFFDLDRELERVNDFFLYKRSELERRLAILQEKVMRAHEVSHSRRLSMSAGYASGGENGPDAAAAAARRISGLFAPNAAGGGHDTDGPGDTEDDMDSEMAEMDESLIAALLELKDRVQKMIQFCELNMRGFDKILKKFDKNLDRQTRSLYMATRVKQLPFASNNTFRDMLRMVERLVAVVERRVMRRDTAARIRLQTTPPPKASTMAAMPELSMDVTSANGPSSAQRTKLRRAINMTVADYDQLLVVLDTDDADTLRVQLDAAKERMGEVPVNSHYERAFNKLLTLLMTRALHRNSIQCAGLLIDLGAAALAKDDVNERTLLHRLALHGGRLPSNPVDDLTRRKTASSAAGAAHLLTPTSQPTRASRSAHLPPVTTTASAACVDDCVSAGDDDPTLIELVLSRLPASFITDAPDIFGRRPLHYAALNGFACIARALIHDLHRRHTEGGTRVIDLSADAWCDNEGYTPLFYAVLRGHAETVRVLIDEGGMSNVDVLVDEPSPTVTKPLIYTGHAPVESAAAATAGVAPSSVAQFNQHYAHTPLILATRLGYVKIMQLLIERGANINFCDSDGETPLHQAVRYGFTDCVRLLLDSAALPDISPTHKDKSTVAARPALALNLGEYYNNWSPLFIAAVEGHQDIVEMLLAAGADATLLDNSGWSCYEHAMFRGYFNLGEMLRASAPAVAVTTPPVSQSAAKPTDDASTTSPTSSVISDADSGQDGAAASNNDATAVGRAYGHKFLKEQCELIVTLGSSDVRRLVEPVLLKNTLIPLTSVMPGTCMSLIVRAEGAVGEPAIRDLPLRDEDMEPIVFRCSEDTQQVVLLFDIVPKYRTGEEVVGRATALVPCNQLASGTDGNENYSWLRFASPIIGSKRLEMLGQVHFETMLVRPFKHPAMHINARNTYWRSITTQVIGHRGAGANRAVTGPASLQIGENTVLSFITAASLGAEYIEFDVQLTRDMVPVIYHDWTVTETGLDIPVGKCTLQQFLSARPHDASLRHSLAAGPDGQRTARTQKRPSAPTISTPDTEAITMDRSASGGDSQPAGYPPARVERSLSLIELRRANQRAKEVEHRRMATTSTMEGKMKGNSFGTIQAPFATLQEALIQVPKHAGFNIEVKYPMANESEPDQLRPIDLNAFIDSVLECVYTHAGDRNILFSSFHPDVCLLLSRKQPNFPVFFLTDAGTEPVADYRCISVQHAVRFARSADLLGLVTVSDPIVQAPRLVRAVKETGLLLFTYGRCNNDVEAVRLQRQHGVDAVIVDKVMLIRKGLQND